MKKLLFIFCALALPAAYAADKTFRFSLHEQATLNGTELKAGDYRVQIDGDKATIRVGNTEIDVAVKVETADHKFRDTMVALEGPSGHHRLSEIDLGGSNTRIVFSSTVAGR